MKRILIAILLMVTWQADAQTILPLNKGNDTIIVSNVLIDSSIKFPKYASDSSFLAIDSNGKVYTVPNANLAIMDLQQVINNGNTASQSNTGLNTYEEFGDGKIILSGDKGAGGDSVYMRMNIANGEVVTKSVRTAVADKTANTLSLTNEVKIESKNTDNGQSVSVAVKNANSGSYLKVSDGRTSPKGIEYAGDYSATYSDRSLVDKAYVQQAISDKVDNSQLSAYVTNDFLANSNNLRVSRILLGDDNSVASYAANINAGSLGYNHGLQINPTASGIGLNILNGGYLYFGESGRMRMHGTTFYMQSTNGSNWFTVNSSGDISTAGNIAANRLYTTESVYLGATNRTILSQSNTATRNVSFPDKSGTVALIDDVAKKVDTSYIAGNSFRQGRLLMGADNGVSTFAANINATSMGYSGGLQINPTASGTAVNILNDGYVSFGSTRCQLRGLPSGITFYKSDYTILASITSQGALQTSKPTLSANTAPVRFGAVITGSDNKKYYEVEIFGIMHYVPVFTTLP